MTPPDDVTFEQRPGSGGGSDGEDPAFENYHFRLYVAGETPKSLAAIANLTRLCDTYLAGRHTIEVLDLARNPEMAAVDQIMAIPTLVRSLPPPLKRVIGTLSDPSKFLVGLEITRGAP